MLTKPITNEPTIGDTIARFADVNSKDAATMTSALRALFGGEAEKVGLAIDHFLKCRGEDSLAWITPVS